MVAGPRRSAEGRVLDERLRCEDVAPYRNERGEVMSGPARAVPGRAGVDISVLCRSAGSRFHGFFDGRAVWLEG